MVGPWGFSWRLSLFGWMFGILVRWGNSLLFFCLMKIIIWNCIWTVLRLSLRWCSLHIETYQNILSLYVTYQTTEDEWSANRLKCLSRAETWLLLISFLLAQMDMLFDGKLFNKCFYVVSSFSFSPSKGTSSLKFPGSFYMVSSCVCNFMTIAIANLEVLTENPN